MMINWRCLGWKRVPSLCSLLRVEMKVAGWLRSLLSRPTLGNRWYRLGWMVTQSDLLPAIHRLWTTWAEPFDGLYRHLRTLSPKHPHRFQLEGVVLSNQFVCKAKPDSGPAGRCAAFDLRAIAKWRNPLYLLLIYGYDYRGTKEIPPPPSKEIGTSENERCVHGFQLGLHLYRSAVFRYFHRATPLLESLFFSQF